METNPVRACIVPRAGAYRWSSAPAHLTGADPSGLLDLEAEDVPRRWQELLAEAETADQLRLYHEVASAGSTLLDPISPADCVVKLWRACVRARYYLQHLTRMIIQRGDLRTPQTRTPSLLAIPAAIRPDNARR